MMDWESLKQEVNIALMIEVQELKRENLELKAEITTLKSMNKQRNEE